jgi:hypothetical protein
MEYELLGLRPGTQGLREEGVRPGPLGLREEGWCLNLWV